MTTVTIPELQRRKESGEKIVGVVAWDYHVARIVDELGVDLVSVGDTVGVNLWGQRSPLEVTMDELMVVARAVRRGVRRALVSCDFPFGPLQEGTSAAVRAAIRLAKEAGADLVKLDGAADFPEAVERITQAGVPVIAQFGITPQTALKLGVEYRSAASAQVPEELTDEMIAQARRLEQAGAVMLNFTNSGPVVGPKVVEAVSIPVIGGFGGGPWLDGRIRMVTAAVAYRADLVDSDPPDAYVNVARHIRDAVAAYAGDVRGGRQIKGGIPPEGSS